MLRREFLKVLGLSVGVPSLLGAALEHERRELERGRQLARDALQHLEWEIQDMENSGFGEAWSTAEVKCAYGAPFTQDWELENYIYDCWARRARARWAWEEAKDA